MRRIAFLALSALLIAPVAARAEYPERTVRVVVPVAAGGGVDVMARLIAQKLSEGWASNSSSRTAPAPPA